MKKIYKDYNNLIFEYSSDNKLDWLIKNLNDGEYYINGFEFSKENILDYNEEENIIKFSLSEKVGDYYPILVKENHGEKKILFQFFDDIELNLSKLMVGKYSNIFNEIAHVINNKDIIVVGGIDSDIPADDFKRILKQFPTHTEKELYYYRKIQLLLNNYIDDLVNFDDKYESHVRNKKINNKKLKNELKSIIHYDIERFEIILESLKSNLAKSELFSEAEWKKYIAEIILLLFPKYINYHPEAYVKLTKSKKKREFPDFILVKDNGAVDVLEVKKPDCDSIISNKDDHGNYYSTKTLSIAVMQTEKYIYNLNRNLSMAEDRFDLQYSKEYPKDFKFRIMNPKGMLIVGQSDKYTKNQLQDLEIIRRMYSNIIEIMTYDDMINMLERQIELLKKRCDEKC